MFQDPSAPKDARPGTHTNFNHALDYSADTEFNAILRARGIIPDMRPNRPRSPSPEAQRSPSPSLSDLDNMDDDDDIPRSVLEAYRESRMAEVKVQENNRKFGRVYPISKSDYTREVTEASKLDLEGEPEGSGTGVICCLYKPSIPDCKLLMPILDRLAAFYPSSKFVSIISDHCIENYPDKNCPTLLVYRKGDLMGQIVGIGGMGGKDITFQSAERLIFAFRGIDFALKVTEQDSNAGFSSRKTVSSSRPTKDDSDGDDSDEDQTRTKDQLAAAQKEVEERRDDLLRKKAEQGKHQVDHARNVARDVRLENEIIQGQLQADLEAEQDAAAIRHDGVEWQKSAQAKAEVDHAKAVSTAIHKEREGHLPAEATISGIVGQVLADLEDAIEELEIEKREQARKEGEA
ncbi:hypothetical protein MNV49_003676 [Pseudohyphozyma bogoriensis]|nr:hypothetical protein MNV49_003676 [Pseudohyphozyma bogoriensis]